MSNTYNYHHPIHSKQTYHSNNRGFTIVELLIVIVVIAILAAISVVAYNGIQSRATQTANFAAIRNYLQAFQLMKTETGSLPEGFNNDSSCLGSACATVVGTSTATISGQTPSVASTSVTKNLLAAYGLTVQPDVKGASRSHLVYSASYWGEPALLWVVGPSQDCISSTGRFRINGQWVDGLKRSEQDTKFTLCNMSLRDL